MDQTIYIPREQIAKTIVPIAKKLGIDLKVIPGEIEAISYNANTNKAKMMLPVISSYPAAYHELGHVIVSKRYPFVSKLSDITFPLVSVSPLIAAAYLIARRRALAESPLKVLGKALLLWKLPTLPLFGEELLASHVGRQLAMQYGLPQARESFKINVPLAFTYLY